VSFLYKMARSIAGTLIDVGKGRLKPSDLLDILLARDRSRGSATPPAKGLCLMVVEY
jgi:tRNA pseudouridine38-40 synthase